jgi:predicted nucleic acid-binding protein
MSADNSVIIFDAYAWVEYALDTPKAERVAELLESASEAITPASVLAELKESMLRQGIRAPVMNRILTYIRSRTTVVGIDSTVAELAGEINFTQKRAIKNWGMLDSFVYATAKVRRGTVLTGDPHFKRLKDVVYIGA